MKKFLTLLVTMSALASCIKSPDVNPDNFNEVSEGVFVACQGGWGSANASLDYYKPETKEVENGIFYRANSARFGDVAQSLTLADGVLYAVVNNSGVVYAIDPETFVVKKHIEELISPRYVTIASKTKGYISTLNADYSYAECDILVFNPQTMVVTDTVKVADTGSIEQMIVAGDKLYAACWTNGRSIAVIDTETDKVESSIEVGIQPCSMAFAADFLWVVCDGGGSWCPLGNEQPSLWKIDPKSNSATKIKDITRASEYNYLILATDGKGEKLYLLNGNICEVKVPSGTIGGALIAPETSNYLGLGVDPGNGDIYLADAVDYKGDGKVIRYSADGELIDTFAVGISPSAFAFK